MKYDATNKEHLERLAQRIALIPTEEQLVTFLATLFAKGRLIEPNITAELEIQQMDVNQPVAWEVVLYLANAIDERNIPLARQACIDHLLAGNDLTTDTSVGGWNQEELDSVAEILDGIVPDCKESLQSV